MSEMCTDPEGDEMLRVFSKFYNGAYVDTDISPEEKKALESLYESSYIEMRMKDNRVYAVASPLGKQFKKKGITVRRPFSGSSSKSIS